MKHSTPELIQSLARSENRVILLTSLSTYAWTTRPKLQTETGIPRSTVSRILDEFLDAGLVSRANYRYEVTPFGQFVAERVHSICSSIEAMLRLQLLLTQISNANPDISFSDLTQGELITPTSVDSEAPARRLGDLLHSASHVRLIVPIAIPILLEVESLTEEGMEAFEVVIPRIALEEKRDDLTTPRQHRGLIASNTVRLFSYDGDIVYIAGTIDETAIVGLTDSAGSIEGYIETSDETVRSWTASIVEAYQQNAGRVNTELLTT